MSIVSRVVVGGVCVFGGAAATLGLASAIPQLGVFGAKTETTNSKVVNAIERVEEVALVSLGIQGIVERRAGSELLGVDVPGSERVLFVQYNFTAKLGVDGESVTITQTGEDRVLISVPEFIFIGHDDIEFTPVTETNGVLSWATEEIDELEIVNDVLGEDEQRLYLDSYSKQLRDQVEVFYGSVIHGIAPDTEVEFEFAE